MTHDAEDPGSTSRASSLPDRCPHNAYYADLRCQEALDWRKWTKEGGLGWSFLLSSLSAQFWSSFQGARWYDLQFTTRETAYACSEQVGGRGRGSLCLRAGFHHCQKKCNCFRVRVPFQVWKEISSESRSLRNCDAVSPCTSHKIPGVRVMARSPALLFSLLSTTHDAGDPGSESNSNPALGKRHCAIAPLCWRLLPRSSQLAQMACDKGLGRTRRMEVCPRSFDRSSTRWAAWPSAEFGLGMRLSPYRAAAAVTGSRSKSDSETTTPTPVQAWSARAPEKGYLIEQDHCHCSAWRWLRLDGLSASAGALAGCQCDGLRSAACNAVPVSCQCRASYSARLRWHRDCEARTGTGINDQDSGILASRSPLSRSAASALTSQWLETVMLTHPLEGRVQTGDKMHPVLCLCQLGKTSFLCTFSLKTCVAILAFLFPNL